MKSWLQLCFEEVISLLKVINIYISAFSYIIWYLNTIPLQNMVVLSSRTEIGILTIDESSTPLKEDYVTHICSMNFD